MDLVLHVWRQKSSSEKGRLERYEAKNISPDSSFLEMLDQVNEELFKKGIEPIAFDHDCREGICGACSCVINGIPHGHQKETTTCQLHMRHFHDGDEIYIEPFRAKAFPVIKDLVVDRSAFERIMQKGGFISVNTGGAQDANAILISKKTADEAMDMAQCIGCGACVAACKNASAMLYVAAKISHLATLPQGKEERSGRVKSMLAAMEGEGFGNCSNLKECQGVCPKGIDVKAIAKMNRDFLRANFLD
ncbi:MAG: succinate dehydrogenase/fumarate reductase iron-sulfur subunit [Oligoflexales bacterium]|nr:succinate dehydrogenase/fumarate reductase iron-sulfur subunit [Oligoflexales bacterium]